jgi:hypothetical protein
LKLLAKKHDVIALRILDKAEIYLPDAGILHLHDPETGQNLTVNSSSQSVRERYSKSIQEQDEKLKAKFRKMKIELVTLFTDEPYAPELRKFFKFRIRMKKQR